MYWYCHHRQVERWNVGFTRSRRDGKILLHDKVIGYTMIAPTSSRASYRGVVEVSIFVDQEHTRKGIGTALLSKLMEEAEKKGYWTLYSAIFSVNEGSINLHKKCGFRVIGTREKIAKDKFGNWQSTTIMEWRNRIE